MLQRLFSQHRPFPLRLTRDKIQKHRDLIALFICTFLTLFLFFPVKPEASYDNIPHSLLPLSVIREGNLNLDEFQQADGKRSDPENSYMYYYLEITEKDNVVSAYPIGTALVATPIYLMYSWLFPSILDTTSFFTPQIYRAAYLTATLLTALTACVIYVLLREKIKHHWLPFAGTLLFIFGTEVISVSSRFLWQHTTALLFITLALLMHHHKQLGGLVFFSIAAAACRIPSIVITAPLFLQLYWTEYRPKRKFLFFSAISKKLTRTDYAFFAASVLTVLVLAAYSLTYFGTLSLVPPHYGGNRLTGSVIPALLGLLISPSRGLFVFSPFFAFSAWFLFKQRKTYWMHGLGVMLYILLNAKWDMWWGGTSHGYRMLIEVIPTLTLFFVLFTQDYWKGLEKSVLGIIVLFTVVFSIFVQSIWGAHYGDCGFNNFPVNINNMNDEQLTQKFWSPKSEFVYCWRKMNEPL